MSGKFPESTKLSWVVKSKGDSEQLQKDLAQLSEWARSGRLNSKLINPI